MAETRPLDPGGVPLMRRIRRIHFIGIGGAGMSGIAEVLLNLGYAVSGSDLGENDATRRLAELGATVGRGHDPARVADADVVVTSSAVTADNPEWVAAREARVPVVPRAEMLAELMRFRYGIAVAGTHGKTTTTSLVASLLAEGGLDPTFVIGGRLNSAAANARLGGGPYLVAEADESDASFLHLTPVVAVVTNIDADHLETYGGDFQRLRETFLTFLGHLPFYGLAVLCHDDPEVRALRPEVAKPVLTYGLEDGADVRATGLEAEGLVTRFELHLPDAEPQTVRLNLPGRHNVRNALAAAAVARELGVEPTAIARGLEAFAGIGRRFQVTEGVATPAGPVTLVDDYGHHPRELAAMREAVAEAWPDRRIHVVFQPHRYTRTRDLLDDFARTLAGVENLVVMEVYPAGEDPIPTADGRSLCRAIRDRGGAEPVFAADANEAVAVLRDRIRAGDVVVTLGAGSIGALAGELPQRLAEEGA